MSTQTIEHLRTDDGVHIALHRLGDASGSPVLLVPGTFSNSTFWLGTRGIGFGRTLADLGYDVWVLDPRGHGESDRPQKHHRWDFDDWAREDIPTALRAVASKGPAAIIGHSAGGAAVLAALAAEPDLRPLASKCVVIATPVPWLQGWRKLGSRLFRRASLVLGRFPSRRLGLGPEDELPHVMAQWMTWNLSTRAGRVEDEALADERNSQIAGFWVGDDGTDYGLRFSQIETPALFIAGGGDRFFAPPEACRALFDLVGSENKTFALCGKATGFSEDYTHDGIVVSKAARTEVWPIMYDWLGDG